MENEHGRYKNICREDSRFAKYVIPAKHRINFISRLPVEDIMTFEKIFIRYWEICFTSDRKQRVKLKYVNTLWSPMLLYMYFPLFYKHAIKIEKTVSNPFNVSWSNIRFLQCLQYLAKVMRINLLKPLLFGRILKIFLDFWMLPRKARKSKFRMGNSIFFSS